MLHERLEQANLEARRQRRRIVMGFVFGASAVALVVLLLGWFETSQPDATVTVTPTPAGEIETVSKKTANPAIADEQRDQFKAALAVFENDVAPKIQTGAFAAWNATAQHTIISAKDAAIGAFSTGTYGDALQTLARATDQAATEITARDTAFDAALNDAQQFAAADNVDQARVAIAEALRLKPDHAAAMTLNDKIERLPDVLDLIGRTAVARAENDFAGEAALLRQTLEIDPTRPGIVARLKTVQAAIREAHFNDSIAAGLQYVAARDLSGARQSLAAAEAIFHGRDELSILQSKVDALAHTLKLEKLLRDATAAAIADDWPRAGRYYAEVIAIQPDSGAAQKGQARANTINDIHAALRSHLNAPQRLGAANISAAAKATIDRAQMYFSDSPSLAADSVKLADALDAYATPVPVIVLSDGATNISVRGVGQVGVVERKVISLTPGRFTFEGTRNGYRSKLVNLDIAPGDVNVTIMIACDEPI